MLDVAKHIAEDCRCTASRLEAEASQQFRFIVGIVAVGLILLIVFPWVRAQFERIAFELGIGFAPLTSTLAIDNILNEKKVELNKLSLEIDDANALEKILDDDVRSLTSEALHFARDASNRLSSTRAIWNLGLTNTKDISEIEKDDFTIRGIGQTNHGHVLAGFVGQEPEIRVRIFRSSGKNRILWSSTKIFDADKEIELAGRLEGITRNAKSTLIAVGRRIIDDKATFLVLRSTDNAKSWKIVPVKSEDEDTQLGSIFSVVRLDNDEFLAVGQRGRGVKRRFSVFRSSNDGRDWKAETLRDSGNTEIKGAFYGVAFLDATKTVYAVGAALGGVRATNAIAYSQDRGETWTFVDEDDFGHARASGWLMAIITSDEGKVFAGGTRFLEDGTTRAMSLMEYDGTEKWTSVDLPGSEPIVGSIFSFSTLADGSVLSVGRVGTLATSNVAMLHLDLDGKWRHFGIVDVTDAPVYGTLYSVFDGGSAGIFAGGQVFLRYREDLEGSKWMGEGYLEWSGISIEGFGKGFRRTGSAFGPMWSRRFGENPTRLLLHLMPAERRRRQRECFLRKN